MTDKNFVKRILIVDDAAVERKLVGDLLTMFWPTCEVLEASDSTEGLSVVEQQLPDIVLTDLCMPFSGGLDLLAKLREEECLIPVVVLSGKNDAATAVAALQAGAASFVPKSKLATLLEPTISTVLELAATHRNRRRIIGCLASMDLCFELDNDGALVGPLVKYLQDHLGSLRLCDERELVRIGVGLHESLSNAIHHGNLELDSELRQEDESIYYDMAETRKLIWPYCDRKVQVFASLNAERVKFVIRDEGPGFNHQKVLDPTDAENVGRIGGRGLLLIRSFMDKVSYNDRGNEITLLKYTSAGQKLLSKMTESTLADTDVEINLSPEILLLDEEPAESLSVV